MPNVSRPPAREPKAPGDWKATVTGFNGPGNGTAGTNSQPYALVLSGLFNECGNNAIEAPEVCDGNQLAGQTCVTQGFDQGPLACSASCDAFDTSACEICRGGRVQGDWDPPGGNPTGSAGGHLYDANGNFADKIVITLVETAPGPFRGSWRICE